MSQYMRTIFRACRTGDVRELRRALERGVYIEVQDTWGNTPLYLASLCGHLDILQVLLENGAAYDSSTIVGQRVKLSALTEPIRQELKKYDKHVERGASAPSYAEVMSFNNPKPEGDRTILRVFLTRLLNKGLGYDVVAIHGDTRFLLHRFIILARCPPLAEILMLTHKNQIPAGYSTDITASFSSKASLQKILEYIYTGGVDYDASAIDVEEDAIRLHLLHLAEEMRKNIDTRDRGVKLSNRSIYPHYITACYPFTKDAGGKQGWKEVVRDLSKVAMCGMDEDYHYVVNQDMVSPIDPVFRENCSHDLVINIKDIRFYGQKAMFLCNEEAVYFHSLILPHLEEEEGRYEAININLPPSVILPQSFARIFTYFHNGNFHIHSNIVLGDIIDLCIGTEHLLLPRLQKRSMKLLEKKLDEHNVLQFLKIAQQKKSAEIISTCENYMLTHASEMLTDGDFCKQIISQFYLLRNEVKFSPLLALFQGAKLAVKHNLTRMFNRMMEYKGIYDIKIELDDNNLFCAVSPKEQTAETF